MSPYAAKVHCFLLYKKLDFECFYISPFHVKQDLPIGKQIPVLCVGEERRADSTRGSTAAPFSPGGRLPRCPTSPPIHSSRSTTRLVFVVGTTSWVLQKS